MFHPKQLCHSADLYLQIKGFAFQSNYSPQTPKWGTEGIVTFSTRCCSPWCSQGWFFFLAVQNSLLPNDS